MKTVSLSSAANMCCPFFGDRCETCSCMAWVDVPRISPRERVEKIKEYRSLTGSGLVEAKRETDLAYPTEDGGYCARVRALAPDRVFMDIETREAGLSRTLMQNEKPAVSILFNGKED